MSKGRKVPPPYLAATGYTSDRLAAVEAMSDEEVARLRLNAARFPARVMLGDGRVLEKQPFGAHACYSTRDGMRVMVSDDEGPHGTLRHVSVSYRARDPRWAELQLVRAAFFDDDQDVMMMLPRRGRYVNVHPHCFHLWQTPELWRGDRFV